jgi:hypothetical protein
VNLARLVAGIAAAAALIFGALWWSARPDGPVGDRGAAGRPAAAPAPAPTAAAAGTTRADAAPTAAGGTEPLVPVRASARAQLAIDFERLSLPSRMLDRLAEGEVAAVAAELRARDDDDATLALHALGDVCLARIGDTTLRAADGRQWMAAVPDPDTLARVDATIDAQLAWAAGFRSGCETAGLLRGGSLRNEVESRIRQCSARGNPHCRAIAADGVTGPESIAMLRGAAVLGSVDAQVRLLAHLEHAPAGTPEQQRAREQEARVWRESLAKADPGWRAAFLGCFERDCDPARIDPAVARRTLESAARDGSFGALLSLATSERAAIERAAVDDRGAPAVVAYVNPSETDAYAWRSVSERLALQGCLGVWPNWAALVGATAAAERELRPSQLAEAQRLADAYWSQYGAPVAASRGCGSPAR